MNYLKRNIITLPGLSEKESELVHLFETQGELIVNSVKRKNWSTMVSCLDNATVMYNQLNNKETITNLAKNTIKNILLRNINKAKEEINNDILYNYEINIIDSYLEKI